MRKVRPAWSARQIGPVIEPVEREMPEWHSKKRQNTTLRKCRIGREKKTEEKKTKIIRTLERFHHGKTGTRGEYTSRLHLLLPTLPVRGESGLRLLAILSRTGYQPGRQNVALPRPVTARL
jgi:hypothetical protein